MQIVGITKPIKLMSVRENRASNGVYTYRVEESKTLYGFNDSDILDFSPEPKRFKPEQFGTLIDSATLYFDKSATFPRYKLEGTNYKRCIKVDKADFIVISKDIRPEKSYRTVVVFEDDKHVYVVNNHSSNTNQAFTNSGYNVKHLYTRRPYIYNQSSQILLTIPSKPLITDEELNKKIDKAVSPIMTLDDAKQMITMLNSPDTSVIDLGLKLLAGFSTTATPFSIKTILLTNKKWTSTNARNSVGVKTLLSSLNITRFQAESRFPWNIQYLNDGNVYSEEDLKMGRSLLKISIENYINSALQREIEIFEGPNVGFKINIGVEEK